MFIVTINNGPYTLSPKEFKGEEDARQRYDKLTSKGKSVTLSKKVGNKVTILDRAEGVNPNVFSV